MKSREDAFKIGMYWQLLASCHTAVAITVQLNYEGLVRVTIDYPGLDVLEVNNQDSVETALRLVWQELSMKFPEERET